MKMLQSYVHLIYFTKRRTWGWKWHGGIKKDVMPNPSRQKCHVRKTQQHAPFWQYWYMLGYFPWRNAVYCNLFVCWDNSYCLFTKYFYVFVPSLLTVQIKLAEEAVDDLKVWKQFTFWVKHLGSEKTNKDFWTLPTEMSKFSTIYRGS